MIKNMASAFALTAFLGVGALAQYAEVTRWYDVQPDQGKITFYVMMNGVGTYPEYNETCFQLLTDPGGRQWYSGTTGVNFALCSQDAFYEAYQEAGTYEVETTAYAVPYQGYPPFVPFNYDLGPKVQVVIQPWLKLDPGGWSPATAATAGGVSHLMAQVTTSRGCSGTVKLDAAYSFPPGLKTVSTPTSHVQGSVNEIKITWFNFGKLELASDNQQGGAAQASVQLGTPVPCTVQKDPMFGSNLTIQTTPP